MNATSLATLNAAVEAGEVEQHGERQGRERDREHAARVGERKEEPDDGERRRKQQDGDDRDVPPVRHRGQPIANASHAQSAASSAPSAAARPRPRARFTTKPCDEASS